ncbi:hypothetical protein L596_026130 [Steinernema carpocapsae]|uniref:TIL domain-containing protein n=2 Tax=Steinernema carpocapsae TaxID=34508 RepID=A0A4U5M0J6_STECR|nr:hypothetical protein L596_026130 [Steinernema carpocapsae]
MTFVRVFLVSCLILAVYCELKCTSNELLTSRMYRDQFCNSTVYYVPPMSIGEPRCACFEPFARDDKGNCVTAEKCAKQLCADVKCPIGNECHVVKSKQNVTAEPGILFIFKHVAGCTLKI